MFSPFQKFVIIKLYILITSCSFQILANSLHILSKLEEIAVQMNPYCEKVDMPDEQFRIKGFISSSFEHVLEVHPHWHEEIEILYVLNGHAVQQVNDSFFTVVPGDLVIIGSGQLHSTYSYQGNNCDIRVLMFDASSILECVKSIVNSPISNLGNSVIIKNPLKASDAHGKELLDCLLEIQKELDLKQKGYIYIVKSFLYKMISILERNDLYETSKVDSKKVQAIRQMLENSFKLIDQCYSEEIDLKKASAASNLSIPHFCRLFRKATGMTFNDYLIFYRVNRAEKLLRSQKKITEIAMECGFGSLSSFIRNFKKYKNCTPTDYKNL